MTPPTDTRVDDVPERAGLSGGLLSVVFLAVVAVGALTAWLVSDGSEATAAVGERAPAFELVTFEGETFDIDEHLEAGRGPVVLNLWASWCEPCLREFPLLSDFAAHRPGVTVVGVAVQDEREPARRFAAEIRPGFVVGWDADGSIRDAYPSFGLPTTFVIEEDGVISDIIPAELTEERLRSITFTG